MTKRQIGTGDQAHPARAARGGSGSAAMTTRRYDLVVVLDTLGYRTTPEMWGTGHPARRDHWFVTALTNVIYASFWIVSAALFGIVWLAVRAAEVVSSWRRQK